MSLKRKALVLFALGLTLLMPSLAYVQAQTSSGAGLVPCGVTGDSPLSSGDSKDIATATECDACHLVQLTQNIINFLVRITISVAIVMLFYAGWLYMKASVSPKEMDKGKKIFGQALIGFLIAISAWIIVNTILFTLLDSEQFPESSWFHIECSESRLITADWADILQTSLGVGPEATQISPDAFLVQNENGTASLYTCPPGYDNVQGTATCYSSDPNAAEPNVDAIPYTVPASRSVEDLQAGIQATEQYAAELGRICRLEGITSQQTCDLARAIMVIESSGNTNECSGAGACGLMQLMPDTARGLDPEGVLKDLNDADVQTYLKEHPNYNMTLGVRYINELQNQGFTGQDLVAAYNGGPRANNPSTTCPGQNWWECQANYGYRETRAYVPNVFATYQLLNQ